MSSVSSLRVCKPAYCVLVPRQEIGRVATERASIVKIPWGAWPGYPHCCLYGCYRPASGHIVRGVSERGPAINQEPHQIQNQASIKEVWVLVLGFVFLSAVSPGSP